MIAKTVIIIPAKGQSKRLPEKNKKLLDGFTLVEYAIKRSVESGLGDVIISSDDDEILALALRSVPNRVFPFKRNKEMSNPDLRLPEVLLDLFERIPQGKYDDFILTLPTSPLATYKDLQNAYYLFSIYSGRPVMSVTNARVNPNALGFIRENNFLPFCIDYGNDFNRPKWKPDFVIKGTKIDLYKSNGAVFVCGIERFKEERDFYINGMLAYEMSSERGIDIDTELDFLLAETLMRKIN